MYLCIFIIFPESDVGQVERRTRVIKTEQGFSSVDNQDSLESRLLLHENESKASIISLIEIVILNEHNWPLNIILLQSQHSICT